MQKINHSKEYKSVHPIFDEFERFYFATSENSLQTSNSLLPFTFDRAFEELQGIFNEYGHQNYQFNFVDRDYKQLKVDNDNSNLIVAFSGGKDSVAAVLKYMEFGYNIYLYHVKGLKKNTYPDEWKSAQEVAEYLNLPLIIDEIEMTGKLEFPEHPLKNIIIANRMLQWGIENNIGTRIAVGNYLDSFLDGAAFYYAGDDCIDMYEAYEDIMRKIIPDFVVMIELENSNDTLQTIVKQPKILPLCQSCLCAHRFREYNRKKTMEKYDINLMPKRCGVCWKCAVEYIYMADHNVLEYNEEYYKHCIDVIKKANKKENGLDFTTIEDLWKVHFHYDISESKWTGIRDYGKRKRIK